MTMTRRTFLQRSLATTAVIGSASLFAGTARAATGTPRGPGSLPHPGLPPGTADASLPFEHVVIVMQENHSFDNYFGMLPQRGQPLADGFTFDAAGVPQNDNPAGGGRQRVFHLDGTCQPNGVTQTWDATHFQVNGGAMDGFARTDSEAMGYLDEGDIPFYYSLAKTFCLGNRYFCSIQGQTYPNRRSLYSATPNGTISSSSDGFFLGPPSGGTLMDLLARYNLTAADYFTDLPDTAIIPQDVVNHPGNYHPIAQFYSDCAAGLLPNVAFVNCEMGVTSDIGDPLQGYLRSLVGTGALPASVSDQVLANKQMQSQNEQSQGQDEENPQDTALGEEFTYGVVQAVMASPLWASGKILLIWTYDEHGGYYDHVYPPAAVVPDSVKPMIAAGDYQDDYDRYGIRVPNVVVSPYSKPGAVTDVVHDHTSILATIEAKWNLPAMTHRDANATTLLDYLDLASPPAFAVPPKLAMPALPADVLGDCKTSPQAVQLESAGAPAASLPDSPLAAALPVAALAAGAVAMGVRHRRAIDDGDGGGDGDGEDTAR